MSVRRILISVTTWATLLTAANTAAIAGVVATGDQWLRQAVHPALTAGACPAATVELEELSRYAEISQGNLPILTALTPDVAPQGALFVWNTPDMPHGVCPMPGNPRITFAQFLTAPPTPPPWVTRYVSASP